MFGTFSLGHKNYIAIANVSRVDHICGAGFQVRVRRYYKAYWRTQKGRSMQFSNAVKSVLTDSQFLVPFFVLLIGFVLLIAMY